MDKIGRDVNVYRSLFCPQSNLAFALRLRKQAAADIARRVAETATLLGLEQLLDRKPKQLSGGQRQRVALGRAIVRQPQVFLFDEPLSNLDARLRVQMRREIGAFRRRLGTTAIYVTHHQVEAMTLGDRIVVMKDGAVQQVATPLALHQRPETSFVASFMGSPPMNLLRGTIGAGTTMLLAVHGSTLRTPLSGSLPAALAPGKEVILGMHPEAIRLGAPEAGHPAIIAEVEPLGGETFLTLDAEGASLSARVEGTSPMARGTKVGWSVATEALHWFDGETERRID